ncbi:hypothetical protein [Rhizobium rhizogenes]|nr:hypothetical protein [Rhizobium rhizogenes]MCZ7488997.1 hypothetical protein [Rhizobium rhizogenes]
MRNIDSGADAGHFAGTDAVAFRARARSQHPRLPASSDAHCALEAA